MTDEEKDERSPFESKEFRSRIDVAVPETCAEVRSTLIMREDLFAGERILEEYEITTSATSAGRWNNFPRCGGDAVGSHELKKLTRFLSSIVEIAEQQHGQCSLPNPRTDIFFVGDAKPTGRLIARIITSASR